MKDRSTRGAALLTTAVTLVSTLLTAAPVASASTTFSDVNGSTSYYQGIQWAYDHGILSGYGNGMFGPDNCVRRAELVKMIVNYAVGSTNGIGNQGSEPNFSDVRATDWFYGYVKEAKFRNYVQGYPDGSFKPNACVNRAEAMKIAYGALLSNQTWDSSGNPVMYDDKVVTDISVYAWYAPYARAMFRNRLVGTDHTVSDPSASTNYRAIQFFPSGSMARKEVAEMIYRISNFTGGTPTPAPTPNPTPNPTNVNITYQAPVTNYTSMPSQINFQWTANVTDSTLVLEYRDPNNISTIAKTTKFTSASGYSKTLSLNDYQTDFTNYRTFCWKLEKTGTNYLSSSNGYPCVSYNAVALTAPGLVYPANNTSYYGSNPQLTVTWSPAQGATRYELMVRFGGASTYNVYPINTIYNPTTNQSFYVPIGDFPALTTMDYTHHWKVRAYDASNNYMESPEWAFNVYRNQAMSVAPVLISPTVEVVFHGSQTINFTWTPVTGASYYILQIRNGTAGGSYFFSQSTTNASYSSYQNAPATTNSYYWRVVAYDASGNSLASTERLYLVSPN